jgi:hypothetical protein
MCVVTMGRLGEDILFASLLTVLLGNCFSFFVIGNNIVIDMFNFHKPFLEIDNFVHFLSSTLL